MISEMKRRVSRKLPVFHIPLAFNLHDHIEPLRIPVQSFNTNCPSPYTIRWCKNISEKFNLLCTRTDRRTDDNQTDLWRQGECNAV